MTVVEIPDLPPETHEIETSRSPFELQTAQQFRDDFVAAINAAGLDDQIAFETMQFEVCDNTLPIFDALRNAKQGGVKNTSFRYDRVARQHLRDPEGQGEAWFRPDTLGGLAIYGSHDQEGKTEKNLGKTDATSLRGKPFNEDTISRLSNAFQTREALIAEFEAAGITDPRFKERGGFKPLSHDHTKLAIVGSIAWLGTMNQRAVDYEWSNFMIKVTDPDVVAAIKHVYAQDEKPSLHLDEVLLDNHPDTRLLFDVGNRGESVVYQHALEIVDSLQPDDEITMIGQWPPVSSMYGSLAKNLMTKLSEGAKGTFLLSPEKHLHPNAFTARLFKKKMDKRVAQNGDMSVVYLARQTHAKALLVKRARGSMELLGGSHNFTSWTVFNGTRELAIHTTNSDLTTQMEKYLDSLQAEQN